MIYFQDLLLLFTVYVLFHFGVTSANLPAENICGLLSEHTSGVYFGWAKLSTRGIYKMVMSIGWNPYFNNTEKTVVSTLICIICSAKI